MALKITAPSQSVFPVGMPFRLKGEATGGETAYWSLDSNLTLVSGSVTDASIEVMFNAEGAASPVYAATDPDHKSEYSTPPFNLFGVCCHCQASYDVDGNGNQRTFDPLLAPIPPVRPNIYERFSDRGGGRSGISLITSDKVIVRGDEVRVPVLGGALDLSFYRANGSGESVAYFNYAQPAGSGACRVAMLGFNRQVFWSPYYAYNDPSQTLIYTSDGGVRAYSYFGYDGNKELLINASDLTTEVYRDMVTYYTYEITKERTYFVYDDLGHLARQVFLSGSALYYNYNGSGRLESITGDLPGTIDFQYNADGNLSQATHHGLGSDGDKDWVYEYSTFPFSARQTVTKVTDPEGFDTQFDYVDAGDGSNSGLVKQIRDPESYDRNYENAYFKWAAYFSYECGFLLSKAVPPVGTATEFGYDPLYGTPRKYTLSPSLATYYAYDPSYLQINRVQLGVGGATQYYQYNPDPSFSYPDPDPPINLTEVDENTIDRLGRVTYFRYDKWHNKLRQQDALNNPAYFAYDDNNKMTASLDELGRATYYDHDAQGNNIRVTDALLQTATMAYDRGGVMTRRQDFRGNTTYYSYDAYGRQTQIQDPLNNTSLFAHDTWSNLTASVNPRWPEATQAAFTTYYTYDKLNRQTGRTDPLGNVVLTYHTKRVSDGPKATKQPVDGQDRWTYFQYDGISRQVVRTDALNNVFQTGYVGATPLVNHQQNARSYTTYFSYDGEGRQTQQQNALNNTTLFGYDKVGNRTAVVGPRWPESTQADFTTYFSFDALNRQVAELDPLGNSASVGFDAVGNRLKSQNKRGFTTYYTYDALNRQVATSSPLSESSYTGYDENGNAVRQQDALGHVTYFTFDPLNRQVATLDALGSVSSVGLDAAGNRVRMLNARGFTSYYQYDRDNRQVADFDALGNTAYWGYNEDGEQLRMQDRVGATTYYEYDLLGRRVMVKDALLNVTRSGFDPNGNLARTQNPRLFTTYYAYDALDRQASVTDSLDNVTRTGYDAAGNRVRAQNARGYTTYYTYDRLNRTDVVSDALSQTTSYGYLPTGEQSQVLDPRGNATYYFYDADGRKTLQLDQTLQATSFGYDAVGNLLRTFDPLNNFAYFTYDALNRQVESLDALLQSTQHGYDEVGNRVRTLAPAATGTAFTYFVYDALNRLIREQDVLLRTTYYQYDANGNQTLVDRPGTPLQVTLNYYDALNRLIVTVDPVGATYYFYDAAGNRIIDVRPEQGATYYGFDGLNRVVQTLDSMNGSTYFVFDANGNTVRSRDRLGAWTYFEYDELDRVKTTTDALLGSTSRTYDPNSNLASVTPPTGSSNTFSYDSRNLQTQSSDGVSTFAFGYDRVGNRTASVSPRSYTTYYGFDGLYRNVATLNSELEATYFGYDPGSNRNRILKFPSMRQTYFGYDALGRQTGMLDAVNLAVYFGYDDAGNRAIEMDALLHATYYGYDTSNRLVADLDPLLRAAYYGYDSASNLVRMRDRNGTSTYYGYDSLLRRTRIQYPSESQYFGYDASGNLLRVLDGYGATYFGYDALNRLTSRQLPLFNPAAFGYDANSNRNLLLYPTLGYGHEPYGQSPYGDPFGPPAYFVYDSVQRMSKAVSPGTSAAYFGYDVSSNLTQRRFGNAAACYYSYDKVERGLSIRHAKDDGTAIAYFVFGRDNSGRIVRNARETDLAAYYTYDDIDRLLAETWIKPSDGSQIYGFSYGYDAAHNRLTMRREGAAGVETESAYYSYAADNSLTRRQVYTPPSTFVDTYYYYDSNGALISLVEDGDATDFAYGDNQLVTRVAPASGNPWYFYYDGQFNRYAIDKGGTVSYYLWDGLKLLQEWDATGTWGARYTQAYSRNPDIGSIAEVQRYPSANVAYFQYLHMDHRGTVAKVTDADQNTQIEYTLDAFGRELAAPTGSDPSVPNDFVYQSGWMTVTIGGKRYGLSKYRLYDFETGTFLSRDFLPYLNKYKAWSNNPVGQIDDNGLEEAFKDVGDGVDEGVGQIAQGSSSTTVPAVGYVAADFTFKDKDGFIYWQPAHIEYVGGGYRGGGKRVAKDGAATLIGYYLGENKMILDPALVGGQAVILDYEMYFGVHPIVTRYTGGIKPTARTYVPNTIQELTTTYTKRGFASVYTGQTKSQEHLIGSVLSVFIKTGAPDYNSGHVALGPIEARVAGVVNAVGNVISLGVLLYVEYQSGTTASPWVLPAIYKSAEGFGTSVRQIFTGEEEESLTFRAVTLLGGSETTARRVDFAVDLAVIFSDIRAFAKAHARPGVWTQDDRIRGVLIEDYTASNEYRNLRNIGKERNGFYEGIDFYGEDVGISQKSTRVGKLTTPFRKNIRRLDKAVQSEPLEGIPLLEEARLDIRIPPGSRQALASNLAKIETYAKRYGVTVRITEIDFKVWVRQVENAAKRARIVR